MTSVSGINGSTIVAAGNTPRREASTPREPKISSSRALVPLTPVAPSETPVRARPRADAGFLAHLIATDQKAPQTRERRRAEPAEAIAAYTAMNAAPAAPTGFRVWRAM